MTSLKSILIKPAFYRRFLMVVMIVLILARPQLSPEDAKRELTNLNIWFVVDATGSMVAKDVDNKTTRRYEKVQADITEIVTKLPGAKYGIIAQDYASYVASPISTNADATIGAEAYIKPKNTLYALPTNLSELLEYASEKIATYRKRTPERANVLIFMSDGEDISDKEVTVPNGLTSSLEGAFVFGYGTTEGSLIENIGGQVDGEYDSAAIVPDDYVIYYGDDERVEINSSHRVISKINETNLKKIASGLHGNYHHRENGAVPASVIDAFTNIAMSKPTESTEENTSTGGESYWIFALILLFLLLWECEDTMLKLLSEREVKHA